MFDLEKFMICAHEAAHAIVFQYYSYGVHNIVVNYNLHSLPQWSGCCTPKNSSSIKNYHLAVISYAGWWIENYIRPVSKDAFRFSFDMKACKSFDYQQLDKDVEYILEQEADALIYLTGKLYERDRILMTAPFHYDKIFAEWEY